MQLFPNNLWAYGTKCYISLIAHESSHVAIRMRGSAETAEESEGKTVPEIIQSSNRSSVLATTMI